jgi:glycosyltransferase involved in cell wall biosynthesis
MTGARVLMVAYHFPPSGAVAAQRASKFARYLPEFGWEPVVVARRPDSRQPWDPSFAGRPAPRVRLGPLEPARMLGLLPRAWIDPLRRFLFVPDEELGWAAALAARLPSLVLRFRPDVLWANSVPNGSLVATAWAARRVRLPWVADFHNEWTRNMYYRPPTRAHDALHRRLERFVVESARRVVTLNPLHTDDLRRRFPAARVETIENGFDPADFEIAPLEPGRRPIVLTYSGAVYGYQSPVPFLRALSQLGRRDVEVRIVGDRFGGFRGGEWPFPVRVCGHRPHRELGRIYSESSGFFLCLEPPAARQLPAKLYEYLGAGRPVFAIAPRGGAVDAWLRRTGAGVCAPAEDPGAWVPRLAEFLDGIDRFQPSPAAGEFHRRAQAGRLAAILDEARRGP